MAKKAPGQYPTAGYVRSQLPETRTAKSNILAISIFSIDIGVYLASLAAILLVPFWPVQIVAIAINGFFIASLFIIGHDACHGSFTSSRLLNHIIGRIAFLPSLNNFTAWDVAQNQLHHGYTNLKGIEDVYVPLSKSDYDQLSGWGKLVQRFYRTNVGIIFYYQIEVWIKRTIIPRKFDLNRMRKSAFILDRALVAGFFVGEVAAMIWLVPLIQDYFVVDRQLPIINIVRAVCLPFVFWIYLFGIVTLLHHTNPNVPWFDKRSEWNYFNSQIRGSVQGDMPRWFGLAANNVLEHTAHHADVRIPLYRLRDSQAALRLSFPDVITKQAGLFRTAYKTLKICKLYDYDNHQWTDFSGNPTSPRISIDTVIHSLIFVGFLIGLLMAPSLALKAQGLNCPGNSPVMDTGAGNARGDADNLFARNDPLAQF